MDIIVKVLNLDGVPDDVGDIFDENTEIEWFDEVFVSRDYVNGTVFGKAKLFKEDKAIYAEVSLEDGESYSVFLDCLTPAIGGIIFEREGNYIKKCLIREVAFLTTPNLDSRMKTIKEQLEEKSIEEETDK